MYLPCSTSLLMFQCATSRLCSQFFYEYLIELRRHKRNPESSDKLRRTDSESRVSNSCLIHITLTLVCLMTLCNLKQFYSSPLIPCALQPLASCLEENRYLVLNIGKLLLTPSRRFQLYLSICGCTDR